MLRLSYLHQIARLPGAAGQRPHLKPAHVLLHRWESAGLTGANAVALSYHSPVLLDTQRSFEVAAPNFEGAAPDRQSSQRRPMRMSEAHDAQQDRHVPRDATPLASRDASAAQPDSTFSIGWPMRDRGVGSDRVRGDLSVHSDAAEEDRRGSISRSSRSNAEASPMNRPEIGDHRIARRDGRDDPPSSAIARSTGLLLSRTRLTTSITIAARNDVLGSAQASHLRTPSTSDSTSDSPISSRADTPLSKRAILRPLISGPALPVTERNELTAATLRIGTIEVTVFQPPSIAPARRPIPAAVAHGFASAPLSRNFTTSLGLRQS